MKTAQMKICPRGPTQRPRYNYSQQHQPGARSPHWLPMLSILIALCSYGTSSNLSAADSLAAADTVFRFQSKMAQRGHVASQYALAYMYESGQGTDKDLSLASNWYRQAAQQSYAPAKDRLIYIDILNNGYQPEQQQQWLLSLKQSADDYQHKHQGESAFLLAQLYAAGIAVNKSLSMALKYLHLAEAANVIGSDSEIRRVEAELEALREIYMPADKDTSAKPGKPASGNTTTPVKKQPTGTRPAQAGANTSANKSAASRNHSTAAKRANSPQPRPAPQPAPQPASQAKPLTKSADKHKATASRAATKNTDATASPTATQNSLPAEQNSNPEQPEPHPMQVICSGWQRLNSACR